MTGRTICCILLLALGARAEQPDAADPRVRTYVHPKRIVWQTPVSAFEFDRGHWKVEDAESLLEPKHGQIPERGFWTGAKCRLVNRGVAPGILIDFGRELHGAVQIGSGCDSERVNTVRLRFGESVGEAMSEPGEKGSTNAHGIRDGLFTVPANGTVTIGDSGFRFLRIDLVSNGTLALDFVRAVSLMRTMRRLGAFRCSDERLNLVWDTAVRTVHLCCQEHLWDGIKRDRLVWAGDMHPETMSILTVFGGASVLPESLDYLAAVTDPRTQWMNNIVNYSMWYVRNVAEWYRYTGDVDDVRRRRGYLAETIRRLAACIGPDGVLRSDDRTLLDWPTEHNAPAKEAGTQALAAIAFDEGAFLAEAAGDAALAAECRAAAAKVRSQAAPDPNGSKQAAALLALAGMARPERMFADVLGRNGHEGVSTFYGYYMLEAMSAAGENQRALDTVRDYWGAMLDVGATSFWEDFRLSWTNDCSCLDELPVAGRKDIHGDYGEFCYPGYRHSLCHGWSSGPAAWLINRVLGIRPLAPGCRKVEVKPFLGTLAWAEGAMALPGGKRICVRVEKGTDGSLEVKVDAPEGVEVVR